VGARSTNEERLCAMNVERIMPLGMCSYWPNLKLCPILTFYSFGASATPPCTTSASQDSNEEGRVGEEDNWEEELEEALFSTPGMLHLLTSMVALSLSAGRNSMADWRSRGSSFWAYNLKGNNTRVLEFVPIIIIVISKLLKCHSKAKHRALAYSRVPREFF